MPAKRRTAKSIASSGNSDDPDASDEYRQKRMRNNEAVKKSREKTNKTATERKQRVEALKTENIRLETQIKETEKNIETLKSLLLSNAKNSLEKDKLVKEILAETSDSE
ncbi:CCAAT/enhancer-binding protein gamma [Episyrphus balteatus]|uniref:CCAAT/enhancer-binding protein gamma n=1 Tax=Episyrphus balteatus TaxID=286459 RepID=UPI002485F531|nr:CCAAT/enhancer-binding protein gamma [Episyrphus balteatus]